MHQHDTIDIDESESNDSSDNNEIYEKYAFQWSPPVYREIVKKIHDNLNIHSQLKWHKYDCIGRLGLAHTDIVVRSETLNSKGKSIVKHVVDQIKIQSEKKM